MKTRRLGFLLIPMFAAMLSHGQGVVAGFSMSSGVEGIPFSADVINETSQVLVDGNRIHQETHGKMYRDSHGRTRTETELVTPASSPAIQTVQISDPVENVIIMLDPANKTATVHHYDRPAPPNPPAPGQPGQRLPSSTGIPGQVAPHSQGAPPQAVPLPVPPPPGPRQGAIPSGQAGQLGTREIEGFTATGIRFVRTIEAGTVGNDQPIVAVSETWTSLQLKTTLLSVANDPRSGERTMRLVNIQTGEPDPSLFHIPADYQVRDGNPK